MEPIVGSLQVNVDPEYANIRLEREGNVVKTWVGDSTISNLRVGRYHLSASTAGALPAGMGESDNLGITDYLPQTRNFVITKGLQEQVDITLLPKVGGNLTLLGVPGEAEVTLQGVNRLSGGRVTRSYEELPAVQTNLPYGSYSVEIRIKDSVRLRINSTLIHGPGKLTWWISLIQIEGGVGNMVALYTRGGQFHMGKTGRGFCFCLPGPGLLSCWTTCYFPPPKKVRTDEAEISVQWFFHEHTL